MANSLYGPGQRFPRIVCGLVHGILDKQERLGAEAGCSGLRTWLLWRWVCVLGWKIGPFVACRVRELEEFLSHYELLGGPGVGFIRSRDLGCPTMLSSSVPISVPRAFPFFACGASRRNSRCRAGFRLTIFIEEVLIPWGNHWLREGGFLGRFSLLENVLPSSSFLLRLAGGSPGGGGRRSDIRSCRRFRCQESPKARSRAPLIVNDFGFTQRKCRFRPCIGFHYGASLEELRVEVALRQRTEIMRCDIALDLIVARF